MLMAFYYAFLLLTGEKEKAVPDDWRNQSNLSGCGVTTRRINHEKTFLYAYDTSILC